MGYRHYFHLVDIEECDRIENMDYDAFADYCEQKYPESVDREDDRRYVHFPDTLGQKKVFEFGKLYYEDTVEKIRSHGKPLFANEGMKARFADYYPYRIGKEGLLEAIEIYKQKIINYYEDLFVDGAVQGLPFGIKINRDDIKSIDKLTENARDHLRWWKVLGVVDLFEDRESISRSWMYEHQIFELVRLYKSIDWNKKCLLFYGR